MDVRLKAIIKDDIEKLAEEIVNHSEYEGAWWPDKLTDTIVDAIVLILDSNQNVQDWLSEQGYLKD